jgi:predicted DnaQ family exonuclease/DinG family helicase
VSNTPPLFLALASISAGGARDSVPQALWGRAFDATGAARGEWRWNASPGHQDRPPPAVTARGALLVSLAPGDLAGSSVLGTQTGVVPLLEVAAVLHAQVRSSDPGSAFRAFGLPPPALADLQAPERQLDHTQALTLALFQRALALQPHTLEVLLQLPGLRGWSGRLFLELALRERARRTFFDERPGVSRSRSIAVSPLQPTREVQRVRTAELKQIFGPRGSLAGCLPGYEARPPQLAMAEAVASAFNDGLTIAIEAGTGTGKSLAYLVPALLFATRNGRRVVVSTNTKNLQAQLIGKDIPQLHGALPAAFTAVLLKGRSNYLCRQRLQRLRTEAGADPATARFIARLFVWLEETETGDRDELAFEDGDEAHWALIAAQIGTCAGRRCRSGPDGPCYVHRARARAEAAHLVVVNHALLLADLAQNGRVLPEYEYLIVDEAHHLAEEATSAFSFRLEHRALLRFCDELLGRGGEGGASGTLSWIGTIFRSDDVQARVTEARRHLLAARRAADPFFSQVAALAGAARQASSLSRAAVRELTQARVTAELRRRPEWSELARAWQVLEEALATTNRTLRSLFDLVEPLIDKAGEAAEDAAGEIVRASRALEEILERTDTIVAQPSSAEVYWAETDGTSSALCAAPLDVGPLLAEKLLAPRKTVVLTSATLSTGGRFEYFLAELGLPPDTPGLVLESPFDYRNQALVCVATDMPDPARPDFQQRAEEALLAICRTMRGRTLALFTSYASLRSARRQLADTLQREGVHVLAQGIDGPRDALLARLRQDRDVIVLGTNSFWEGIDVVGEALSCLVIVKLPFSVPTDPIFAARSERKRSPFYEYSLPQAVLRLRQGFGRLIRSSTDRGVVVLLDPRVVTRSYGRAFLQALPRCLVRQVPAHELGTTVATWLAAPEQTSSVGRYSRVQRGEVEKNSS